jgi:hypothetical protein
MTGAGQLLIRGQCKRMGLLQRFMVFEGWAPRPLTPRSFVTAKRRLEGGKPRKIQSATGSLTNIALGMLFGAGGSYAVEFKAGRIALMFAALGIGSSNATRADYEGHTGAAMYYSVLALGGAFLVSLARSGTGAPPPTPGVSPIANPLPATVARVIAAFANPNTLGLAGQADVFVTRCSRHSRYECCPDSAGPKHRTKFFLHRHRISDSKRNRVTDWKDSSPFAQGGLTTGTPAAPEYVVPNGPIPPNANIYIVE